MTTILGPSLADRDSSGKPSVPVATVFPDDRAIVTEPPTTHGEQRERYLAYLNEQRAARGEPRLEPRQAEELLDRSVDLLTDERGVLIRPDPWRMDLAFAADEILQELAPRERIRFLDVADPRVAGALRRRGENWRMHPPPTSAPQIVQTIRDSRVALRGLPLYYYAKPTGIRYLTLDGLRSLRALDDPSLQQHLREIGQVGSRRNRRGHRELELFLGGSCIAPQEFLAAADLQGAQLRAALEHLLSRFEQAVPPHLRQDDPDDPAWRNRMFACLMGQRDDIIVEEQAGLDPELSMMIQWLPGARIEEGELLLDCAYDQTQRRSGEEPRPSAVVRGLILNLAQEYGDLQYINIGSVLPSPDRPPTREGRREVYVAQLQHRRSPAEVILMIKFLRWGVRERLDAGEALDRAMLLTEEYTQYVQDRRLACRQLGMNLSQSNMTVRKVREVYEGRNSTYLGCIIWSPYLQRDYISGVATNRVLSRKLADADYSVAFARLLGQAAAPNLIIGRSELAGPAIFDAGDEILIEDADGWPAEIAVADHVGTLVDWNHPLESKARDYAAPILRRLPRVGDRQAFVEAYLSGFIVSFTHIQREYQRHRRAFDTLFKHLPRDPGGSLAYRWEQVLQRLATADPTTLAGLIRLEIARAASRDPSA